MNAKTLERKRALALMWDCPQLSDRAIARQIGVGNKTVSRWRKEATPDQRLRGAAKVVGDTLAALDQAGHQWQAMLLVPTCPYCQGRALVVANSPSDRSRSASFSPSTTKTGSAGSAASSSGSR